MSGWTFSQVPINATQDHALSDGAYRLLAYLIWRQGTKDKTWPLVATMAADLGVSHDTISRRVKELEDAGYIEVQRIPGKSSEYSVKALDAEMRGSNTQESGEAQRKDALQNYSHERESTNEKDEKPSEPEGEAALEPYFGPRSTPIEETQTRKPRSEEELRQELLEAERRMIGRLADMPWVDYSDGQFKPWEGVPVLHQERVAWMIEEHTKLTPEAGGWRFWGECCAKVYLAGNGEWDVIEKGIKTVWAREPNFRASHAKGFIDEVRKTRALDLQEDVLEVPAF